MLEGNRILLDQNKEAVLIHSNGENQGVSICAYSLRLSSQGMMKGELVTLGHGMQWGMLGRRNPKERTLKEGTFLPLYLTISKPVLF